VRTLAHDTQVSGVHSLDWDGLTDARSRAVPGMYFLVVRVADQRARQRIVLLR
jgi:hypothetical protein